MKKRIIVFLAVFCFCLSGCGSPTDLLRGIDLPFVDFDSEEDSYASSEEETEEKEIAETAEAEEAAKAAERAAAEQAAADQAAADQAAADQAAAQQAAEQAAAQAKAGFTWPSATSDNLHKPDSKSAHSAVTI